MELDARIRELMRQRAADLQEEAQDLDARAKTLYAQADLIKKTWRLVRPESQED